MIPSKASVMALIDEYKTQKQKNRSVTLAQVSSMMCKDAMKHLRSTSNKSRDGAPQESTFTDLPRNVIRKITTNTDLRRQNVKSLARSVAIPISWDPRGVGVRLSKVPLDDWVKTHANGVVPGEWIELGNEYNIFIWLIPYYKLFWRMMDPKFPYARDCNALKALLRRSPTDLTNDEYRRTLYHNQSIATLEAMGRGSFVRGRMLTFTNNSFDEFPSTYEVREGAKHFSLLIADTALEHCDEDVRNLAYAALSSLLKLYIKRAKGRKVDWWAIYEANNSTYEASFDDDNRPKYTNLLNTMSQHPLFLEDAEMDDTLRELIGSVNLQNAGSRRKRSRKPK